MPDGTQILYDERKHQGDQDKICGPAGDLQEPFPDVGNFALH
jgi:hypothetical protein